RDPDLPHAARGRARAARARGAAARAAQGLRRPQAARSLHVADLGVRVGDRRAGLPDAVSPRARATSVAMRWLLLLVVACGHPSDPQKQPDKSGSSTGPTRRMHTYTTSQQVCDAFSLAQIATVTK